MRQVHTPLLRAVAAGALLTAAYAISGLSATAQDATSTTPSSATTTTTKAKVPRTTATPEMISEAVRRSKARHDRFLATGKPEQWGSEEPFTK